MSTPFVDALLPDGSRLHVVIPSITRQHWAINIRKFVARAFDLSGLVALGSLTPQAAAFLDAAVGAGLNVITSVATVAYHPTFLHRARRRCSHSVPHPLRQLRRPPPPGQD